MPARVRTRDGRPGPDHRRPVVYRFAVPAASLFLIPAAAAADQAATNEPARTASTAAAQECDDERTVADRLWTLALGTAVQDDATSSAGNEQAIAGGVLMPFGCGGRWMARTELTAGFRNTALTFFESLFAGVQFGLGRAFGQPRIELGENSRLEWYLLGGGGAYVVHDMPEAPDESGLVPDLAAAIGVRVSMTEEGSLLFMELLREQRFGRWDDRWYLRWAVSWPM